MDFVQKKVPVDPVIANWTKYFAPLDCYTTNNNLYNLLKREANIRMEMSETMFYAAFFAATLNSMEHPHEFELYRSANLLTNATALFIATRDIETWKKAIPDFMHFYRIFDTLKNLNSAFSTELQKYVNELNENINTD